MAPALLMLFKQVHVPSDIPLMTRYAQQASVRLEARCCALRKAVCSDAFTAVQLYAENTAVLMEKRLTAIIINGFIIGECFGGSTEMKLLLLIPVLVLLLGPLRPWVGRHWSFLLSIFIGAVAGFVIGTKMNGDLGHAFPAAPLIGALIGAAAIGHIGPSILRNIERDGKNENSSR